MKKIGFTLSEVLITLSIIGVIAALTVPSLISNYTKTSFLSALKKNYSVFTNAFNKTKVSYYDNYVYWPHIDGDVNIIYNNFVKIKKHLNVVQECKNKEGCWSKELTKKPDGETAQGATALGLGGAIVTFKLNDGTNVCFDYFNQEDTENQFGVSRNPLQNPLVIWVDVNGDKKPNKMGEDVFSFVLTSNGLVPSGIDNDSANCDSSGYDCSAKYIYSNQR